MVEATGLEPAALCSQSRCATKLRYASMLSCIVLRSRVFMDYALLALLRCPKFCCALERCQNFDRCAISHFLHPPPAAVVLNAQSRAIQTALRLDISVVVYINLLFLSTDYKNKGAVFYSASKATIVKQKHSCFIILFNLIIPPLEAIIKS